MKTLRLSLILSLLAIGSNTYSQKEIIDPETYSAKITDWMKTNLQLTAQQIPPVQAINLKYATKLKELQVSSDGKQQKAKTLMGNDQAKDGELKKVLTQQQFDTYLIKKEEIKNAMKEKAKEKRSGG